MRRGGTELKPAVSISHLLRRIVTLEKKIQLLIFLYISIRICEREK